MAFLNCGHNKSFDKYRGSYGGWNFSGLKPSLNLTIPFYEHPTVIAWAFFLFGKSKIMNAHGGEHFAHEVEIYML